MFFQDWSELHCIALALLSVCHSCVHGAGKLNAQNAFMQGQLKIKGNMMLAQKLSLLQAQKAKL